jgi:hypothetical protein
MEPMFALLLALYVGGILFMFDSISEWLGRWRWVRKLTDERHSTEVVRFVLGMIIAGGAMYGIFCLAAKNLGG